MIVKAGCPLQHRPPLDRFGGFTTEAAGRVPFSFWVVTIVVVACGAEFVIGHLISGQLF